VPRRSLSSRPHIRNSATARSIHAFLLAISLAGCSSGGGADDSNAWYNKTMLENAGYGSNGRENTAVVASQPLVAPGAPASGGLVSPNEFYRSDEGCRSGIPATPPTGVAPAEVSLEMTECEVVRRSGSPDKVELSAGPRGERFLALSYMRSQRPRVLRFVSGRLATIENLPEPRLAAKPLKRAKP
jgi:hypothetical protein